MESSIMFGFWLFVFVAQQFGGVSINILLKTPHPRSILDGLLRSFLPYTLFCLLFYRKGLN